MQTPSWGRTDGSAGETVSLWMCSVDDGIDSDRVAAA